MSRLAALALTATLAAGLGACAGRQAGESFTVTPRVQVKETEAATKGEAPRGFQVPPTDEPEPQAAPAEAARAR